MTDRCKGIRELKSPQGTGVSGSTGLHAEASRGHAHPPPQQGVEDLHDSAPHMHTARHIARNDLGVCGALGVGAELDRVFLRAEQHMGDGEGV
eukprot:1160142-Pelagomonas_calceolata.AAC.13